MSGATWKHILAFKLSLRRAFLKVELKMVFVYINTDSHRFHSGRVHSGRQIQIDIFI